jgi:hypothetical protein
VIHASPDRAAASVSVFLDDSTVAAVQAVRFKAIAGYLEVPSGEHRVSVRAARAPVGATPLVASPTPSLDPGARYTAIVHGLASTAPRLAIAVSTDTLMQPDAGKARVRFFHALVGLGAVDVCTVAQPARAAVAAAPNRPAQPARAAVPAASVFTNVAYGAFGDYTEVLAGAPVTLQVRAQGAQPCAGAVRGTVTLTPADRAVVTAVAVGRAPAVARQLLVCGDAPVSGPPSCAALPIR